MRRIHQVLSAAGPVDAVTRQAFAYRRLFAEWGYEESLHAAWIEPKLRGMVEPLKRLRPDPGDLILLHYSAYAPKLLPLLELPQRKLLVYHNVTPADYLWDHHPHVATLCELGRDHLPRFARAVDVAAAVSRFNAEELADAGAGEPRVVPLLLEPDRLEERGARPDGAPIVLGVGRLAPHKRHDLLIQVFALYQRYSAPDAHLLCVGEPLSPGYRERLAELVRSSGARNVELTGALPQADLNAAYAAADVLVSLSEHEGFCMPLLEAFHFGLPVVARPAGGMPEVGDGAVLWVDDGDLAVVAELIDLAVTDAELREELARRGHAQSERYSYRRVASELRSAVEDALR